MSRFRAPAFIALAVFLLSSAVVLTSQTYAQSQAATPAPAEPRVYDATKEVVLNGTISEVVGRPKAGLPLGLHLMLSTAQGEVDVHLGPYFGRIATQKGLVPGASIRVTGVTVNFAGGDVLLARVIVVGNETLTIRNQNGIPVRPARQGTRGASGLQPAGGL